ANADRQELPHAQQLDEARQVVVKVAVRYFRDVDDHGETTKQRGRFAKPLLELAREHLHGRVEQAKRRQGRHAALELQRRLRGTSVGHTPIPGPSERERKSSARRDAADGSAFIASRAPRFKAKSRAARVRGRYA